MIDVLVVQKYDADTLKRFFDKELPLWVNGGDIPLDPVTGWCYKFQRKPDNILIKKIEADCLK